MPLEECKCITTHIKGRFFMVIGRDTIVNVLFVRKYALAQTILSADDLTSTQAGLAANTDPELVNPWGIAFSQGNPSGFRQQLRLLHAV